MLGLGSTISTEHSQSEDMPLVRDAGQESPDISKNDSLCWQTQGVRTMVSWSYSAFDLLHISNPNFHGLSTRACCADLVT